MSLAPSFDDMSIAKKLIAEIESFADRNPGHQRSIGALLQAVQRIDSEFSGEIREKLLSQARDTFLQQIQILENAAKTRESLEALKSNQKDLAKALESLSPVRPPDATLH